MRKLLLGLAATLVLAPAQVQAADYCAPASAGGFYACAAINVSFDAGTGQLVVEVTNTDLWAIAQGYNPTGHAYAITGFGIEGPAMSGAITLANVEAIGGASEVGAQTNWQITSNLSGFQVYTGAETASGINGGILGCNGTFASYFRTCSGGVTTGFVRFTFNTEMTEWDASQVLIALRAQGENDISYRCTDDPSATNGVPCGTTTTTTPEPVTVLLFGSGLAALGAARRRRRQDSV